MITIYDVLVDCVLGSVRHRAYPVLDLLHCPCTGPGLDHRLFGSARWNAGEAEVLEGSKLQDACALEKVLLLFVVDKRRFPSVVRKCMEIFPFRPHKDIWVPHRYISS